MVEILTQLFKLSAEKGYSVSVSKSHKPSISVEESSKTIYITVSDNEDKTFEKNVLDVIDKLKG